MQGYCGSTCYIDGTLVSEERKFKPTHINMIAGGVSFVSMFQFLQDIANNKNDNTKLALIGAYSKKDQILLKNETDALVQKKRANITH